MPKNAIVMLGPANESREKGWYQSKAAPYHCLPSIQAIGESLKIAGKKVACKTATGAIKFADGTVKAFNNGETTEALEAVAPEAKDKYAKIPICEEFEK